MSLKKKNQDAIAMILTEMYNEDDYIDLEDPQFDDIWDSLGVYYLNDDTVANHRPLIMDYIKLDPSNPKLTRIREHIKELNDKYKSSVEEEHTRREKRKIDYIKDKWGSKKSPATRITIPNGIRPLDLYAYTQQHPAKSYMYKGEIITSDDIKRMIASNN